jgi:hypothetical protein
MAAQSAVKFWLLFLACILLLGCMQDPVSSPQATPVTATDTPVLTPESNFPAPGEPGSTPAPSVSAPFDDYNWNDSVLERNNSAPIIPQKTPTPMPVSELKKMIAESARVALASGTKIVDWPQDWVPTGNADDNPSYYSLAFADLKEVDIGMDRNYLYVKSIYYGPWPGSDGEWPVIDGNRITAIAFNVGIDADGNAQTGVIDDGGTEIQVNCGAKYNMTYGDPRGTFNGYRTNPSGIETPEEKRYLNNYYADAIMLGGPGHDYVVGAYPLKDLALRAGQTVTIMAWLEANSEKYHHADFDPLDTSHIATPEWQRIPITLGENRTIS